MSFCCQTAFIVWVFCGVNSGQQRFRFCWFYFFHHWLDLDHWRSTQHSIVQVQTSDEIEDKKIWVKNVGPVAAFCTCRWLTQFFLLLIYFEYYRSISNHRQQHDNSLATTFCALALLTEMNTNARAFYFIILCFLKRAVWLLQKSQENNTAKELNE